jgi:endonuclease/exonuclease/phosphatase family metal-dependent hydrolase
MRLRILDFNVWSGLTYLGFLKMARYDDPELARKREESMIAQIKELDADVICLHELNPVYTRAKRLAEILDMNYYAHLHLSGIRIGPVGVPWNLEEGDAIFVRKDLRFRVLGRKQMSGGWIGKRSSWNFSDATQIMGISLEIAGAQVPVFTTHWHAGVTPGPDIHDAAERMSRTESIDPERLRAALLLMEENRAVRMKEAQLTLDFVAKHAPQDGFCILSGDFNAVPGTPEIGRILSAGWKDTLEEIAPGHSGYTWHYDENPLHRKFYTEYDPDLYLRLNYVRLRVPHRLDYIFFRPGRAALLSSEIVMRKQVNGVMASDHFGVLAEFDLPG